MEVKEGGIVIIKGDNIENGGMKIVHNYPAQKSKEQLTKESLKEKVDMIYTRITNGRLWFSVCKYMMIEGLVPEDDFKKATDILNELYPDIIFNPKDLSTLNVLSFRKPFEEWDENDSPIKDRKTFYAYKNIGMSLKNE